MAASHAIATLREIAYREVPRTRPSRFLWFIVGAIFAVIACALLYSIGLRIPPFGFGVAAKPGFEKVTVGMAYEKVVAGLGTEDGTLRAAELASFEESLCSYCPAKMDYRAIEEKGGRFLFWLSRSNGLLVFNVVALDESDVVVDLGVYYDTFLGRD